MFIVVHKSWGPAPEYWLLTNKKKAEVPNCFLMVVQGGLGPVDYVSQWLSHQRGDGYCMQWSSWFLSCSDRARQQSWFKIFLSKSWSSWSQDVQVDPVVGDDGVKLLALGHQLHSARESRSSHFGVGWVPERLPVLITPRVVWKPTCCWGISGVVWQTWAGSPPPSSSRPGPACLGRRAGPGTPTHIPSRPECLVFGSDRIRKKNSTCGQDPIVVRRSVNCISARSVCRNGLGKNCL